MTRKRVYAIIIVSALLMGTIASSVMVEYAKDATTFQISNVTKGKKTLEVGMEFTIKTNRSVKKCSYKSIKPSVATVSKSGVIKAKKVGKCTIKITAKITNKKKITKKIALTVIKKNTMANTTPDTTEQTVSTQMQTPTDSAVHTNATATPKVTATPKATAETKTEEPKTKDVKLGIKIGKKVMTAVFEDNSSVEALKQELEKADITIDMRDYANFEKVGPLGVTLPKNDKQITTEPGDVILYQGNQLTIYYDINSWSFTKIAKIENLSQKELKDILGKGDVTVTLTLVEK